MTPQPTHGTVLMQAYCISLALFGNSTPPTYILFLCIHPNHSTDQHKLIVVLICRIEAPLPHLGTTTNLGSVHNGTLDQRWTSVGQDPDNIHHCNFVLAQSHTFNYSGTLIKVKHRGTSSRRLR
jgi:hypothetical protein